MQPEIWPFPSVTPSIKPQRGCNELEIPFFDKVSSSKCTKCAIAPEETSILKYNRSDEIS